MPMPSSRARRVASLISSSSVRPSKGPTSRTSRRSMILPVIRAFPIVQAAIAEPFFPSLAIWRASSNSASSVSFVTSMPVTVRISVLQPLFAGDDDYFSNFEYTMSGKWAELLKQIAPQATRALVLRALTAGGIGQFAAIRSVAQNLGIELTPVNARDADEIERNLAAFARSGNGGVLVTSAG